MAGYIDRWLARRRRMRELELAARAWALLPPAIQADAAHLPIVVRSRPIPADREGYGIPANVSGAFVEGPPVDGDAEGNPGEPAARHGVILLYLDNIKPRTPEGVAGVLLHEISHALGLDEHHTEACGL